MYNPFMQQPKPMEDKARKDQLQAVWFAAGMAVVIACVERAVVLSIFKQWHMWVFLALNLLLIAILFTSTRPSSPPAKSLCSQENDKKQPAPVANDVVDDGVKLSSEEREDKEESGFDCEEDDEDEKSSGLLSNEELNERVEAFISRFRQEYLVSDVKVRSDNVYGRAVFSKTITV